MLTLALLAALQAGTPAPVLDPPRPISQWVHTRWTSKEGAPRNILHLAQSPDGYLWITGWGQGLIRFDGVRFVPIPLKIGDTLPMRGVERIVPAKDNSLWLVLAEGKVGHLKNGYLQAWGEPDGVPRTFEMTMSSTGIVVTGTAHGLFRYADGQWKDMTQVWGFPGKQSHAVWFDSHDGLWASAEDRVVYLAPGGTAFQDAGHRYRNPNGPSPRFAEGRDGTVWIGEQAWTVHTLPIQDGARPMTEVRNGAKNVVVDRKGTLWIGTGGTGLRRLLDPAAALGRKIEEHDSAAAEPFTEKDGLLSDLVDAMLADREGNIWVGGSRGLERFREPPLVPIGSQSSRRARILFPIRDSSLWIAPFASDIQRLQGGQQQRGIMAPWYPTLLTQTTDGRLWSTDTHYLYRLEGRPPYTPVRIRSKEMAVADIRADRNGTLWVFDQTTGLMRLRGDTLVLEVAIKDSVYPHASIFPDSKGIWISFFRRLVRYQNGELTTFPLSGAGTFGSEAWSLLEDGAGAIWVGGQFGIGRLEGDHFRSLTRLPGVPVWGGLTIDAEGAWWYATREGLVRLGPGEVGRAMEDSTYVIKYRRFGQPDGLPGDVNGMLYGNVVTPTADGTLWVATDSGVASIDPRRLPPVAVAPPKIETIRVDDHEFTPDSGLRLPPRPGNLEIDYTAMTLAAPEGMRFRYQLVGEDASWREVGTRRRAYYTGLRPGSYTFRVMSGTPDGAWSASAAVSSFRILPTWYQTLWSKSLAVLLIGGLSAVAVGMVQRRRHSQQQEALTAKYEATLTERARIAQDLHDTLMQGFAGVTLQMRAVELSLVDQPEASARLGRIRELARDSLREARERVWELRDSRLGEDLGVALEAMARERIAGTGIAVTLVSTGHGRPTRDVEEAVFRIAREAVVNAVRHAGATAIALYLDVGATTLKLDVRDDGKGFTPQTAEDARRQGHFGLSGMRERAEHLGGRCVVVAGPHGGTTVTLELPITPAVPT